MGHKKIELKQLSEFLEAEYKNVDPEDPWKYFTCIKSPSDTIINEAFPVMQAFFERIKFKTYIVRKWQRRKSRQLNLKNRIDNKLQVQVKSFPVNSVWLNCQ